MSSYLYISAFKNSIEKQNPGQYHRSKDSRYSILNQNLQDASICGKQTCQSNDYIGLQGRGLDTDRNEQTIPITE